MKDHLAIEIKNLNKTFRINKRGVGIIKRMTNPFSKNLTTNISALKNIDLEVKKGEFIGIIGQNGSGKSTLLKLIIGAIEPDKGSIIRTNGKVIRLALGMGFDPNLTARDNIYLNGTILGMSFKTIGKKFDEIIGFAEIEKFIDTPVKYFSSGMSTRLSFAIALHAEADIYLIDEFFGDVGDEIFKQKSQKALEENLLKGKTVLHVSHSMDLLKNQCNSIFVIDNGEGKKFENVEEGIASYRKGKVLS